MLIAGRNSIAHARPRNEQGETDEQRDPPPVNSYIQFRCRTAVYYGRQRGDWTNTHKGTGRLQMEVER